MCILFFMRLVLNWRLSAWTEILINNAPEYFDRASILKHFFQIIYPHIILFLAGRDRGCHLFYLVEAFRIYYSSLHITSVL